MNKEDYIKIAWADVRAGDVLMHPNGDRLTIKESSYDRVVVNGAAGWFGAWEANGFTPHRKVEPLPTAPGHYLDRYGEHWELGSQGGDRPWLFDGERYRDKDAAKCGPFTRLVPMPTEEAVREALRVDENPQRRIRRDWAVGRVMSLLAGESDD